MFKQRKAMKKNLCFVGMFLCILYTSAPAAAQVQTAKFVTTIARSNAYYEYLPQGYPEPGKRYPLLIFFHGLGETGPGTAASLPNVLRNGPPKLINNGTFPTSFTVNNVTYKMLVISPQFTEWPTEEDTDTLINYMISHYPVDIDRIYLTGLSMGGGVVWNYSGISFAHAIRVAAIVPVCGAGYPYPSHAHTMAAANLPVWATHNSIDNTVPPFYTNDYISLINSSPVPPTPLARKTIFPVSVSTHDAWTATYNPAFRENGMNVYEWMLQYRRMLSVVPVTGLNFNAALVEHDQVNLFWTTEAEINNPNFAIERSSDGIHFTAIDVVQSTAVNGGGASYHYTDLYPVAGVSYYRLAMLNTDGSRSYSNTRDVRIALAGNPVVTLYPNPASDELHLQSAEALVNTPLRISNAAGQVVLETKLNGNRIFTINIAALKPGAYTAILDVKGEKQRMRFVKY